MAWCNGCQRHHGDLYICETYSDAKADEIYQKQLVLAAQVNDPEWQRRQRENNVPQEVLDIFAIMCGGPSAS